MHRSKCATASFVSLWLLTVFPYQHCLSAPPPSNTTRIPSVIRAAIGELAVSKTPVYLPTWLPPQCKGPLDIGSGPFKDGYELWLGTASFNTTFFTSAGKGAIKKTKRSVKLANGATAYVQDLKDFCMDYLKDGYCYRIGLPGYGRQKDVDNLVKIANSMVLFLPAEMKSSPSGADRLAAAYKSNLESETRDKNLKIARNYDSAFDSIAGGNFAKAESQLNDVLKNWSDCNELPPIQQIQLARSLVLKKQKHTQEAERIQKENENIAAKLEADWKEKIEKQTDPSYRATLYRELADFCVARGEFTEAHEYYKKALAQIVPVFGAQSYDARNISRLDKRLLQIEGK